MTYKEFIDNVLKTRGRFINSDEYHERHHIVPKCKNGSNDIDNLIDLYAREHFIAHKLLAEENLDDDQLVRAYTLMAFVKDKHQLRYELTPEEYEEARLIYAKKWSGMNNPAAVKVIRLSDEKIYNSMRECCNDNGLTVNRVQNLLIQNRDFVYYKKWELMTPDERNYIKSINWDQIHHINRSNAAKKSAKKRNENGYHRPCSEVTKAKISEANTGKHGKCVFCPELNESFSTIKAASDKYNINHTSIGYCLNGKQKHAGKHPITGEKLSWIKLENKNS